MPEIASLTSVEDQRRFLKSYAQTYLQEEVIAEQIVRNLPPFRRFLDIVGLTTTEIISYSNIARDIDSDAKTVQRYFEILEDTLLGFHLPSYHKSLRKQQKKSKKFYFFDTGIVRALASKLNDTLSPRTFEYGKYFENFVINEIHRILTYQEIQFKLSFLKVSDKQEIDLIIEKPNKEVFLCEIKSTDNINENHIGCLALFAKDFANPKLRLISRDVVTKKYGDVVALPWRDAIAEICGTT